MLLWKYPLGMLVGPIDSMPRVEDRRVRRPQFVYGTRGLDAMHMSIFLKNIFFKLRPCIVFLNSMLKETGLFIFKKNYNNIFPTKLQISVQVFFFF